MIIFQTEKLQLDLTLYGITLNEESNMFVDNMLKGYSFPSSLTLTPEISLALDLPDVPNMTNLDASLEGFLIVDQKYYEGVMYLGDLEGEELEFEISFGEEVLPVYDSKLRELPWPLVIIESSQIHHDAYVDNAWPAVTHNFPQVYRPKIKQENDYEDFELFCNNSDGTDFIQNLSEVVDNETVYRNKNVLMPCPYVMEMLTFGFKSAGKKVKGAVLDDERLQGLVYFPEKYRERFNSSTFTSFSFTVPDSTEQITVDNLGGLNAGIFVEKINIGVYKREFLPENTGTYSIDFNLNLSPATADYFKMRIYQEKTATLEQTIIYNSESRFNRVTIDEEINIDITAANQFDKIFIVMELNYTTESIAAFNSFEYSYKEGRLNEFAGSYSLGPYMPDMKFGEFVNLIKNWLNLDISINEEFVTMEFVETAVDNFPKVDHSHLQILKPKITRNTNRTFRLNYNDDSFVLADSTGRIFSDLDKEEKNIIEIDMGVSMAIVESNFNTVTAVYPEKDEITFGFYTGLYNSRNVCQDKINGFTGKVDAVYENFWSVWLAIRTNNLTVVDSFMAHHSETMELRSLCYKYNQILLPLSIRRKRKTMDWWDVDFEGESI